MPYSPAPGDQLALVFAGSYSPPSGDQLDLSFEDSNPDNDGFENALALSSALSYGAQAAHAVPIFSAYGNPQVLAVHSHFAFDEASTIEQIHDLPWRELLTLEQESSIQWNSFETTQFDTSSPWFNLLPTSSFSGGHWREGAPLNNGFHSEWLNPSTQSNTLDISWDVATPFDHSTLLAYRHPNTLNQIECMPWRQMSGEIPNIFKPPGVFVEPPSPPLPPPVYFPPSGDALDLDFDCAAQSIQGDKLHLTFSAIPCIVGVSTVINTISLIREADGIETHPFSVELSINLGDWAYRFAASIPYTNKHLVVSDDGPVELRAIVNGFEYLVLAEQWRESWQFGRRVLNIVGRSVSAELAAPAALLNSRDEQSSLNAIQLMNQELLNTGWQLVKHESFHDYLVPGGNFNYNQLAPIAAVARVAEASGAVVIPSRDARTLTIKSRYPVKPWARSTAPADKQFSYAQVDTVDGEFIQAKRYNGVHVAGNSSDGHLVHTTRAGTNGTPALEVTVDPLITAPIAGHNRGLALLGATGKRIMHSLVTGVYTDMNDPGVFEPCELVSVMVSNTESYQAMVTGVAIRAAWEGDSKTGKLIVQQRVQLDQYVDQ